MTTQPYCKTCKFLVDRGEYNGVRFGECRLDPPVVLSDGKTKFPRVRLNDWCGQHQPARDTKS